jgi:hypothetical protein
VKIRHYIQITAAAALTVAGIAVSCGHTSSGPRPGAAPAPTTGTRGSSRLQDSEWFKKNFGTPLVVSAEVTPKTVEQATDPGGLVLPQNHAAVDGPVLWERVRCEALPFTTTDGPTRLRGDTMYGGFAHTPLGAAMAGYHFISFGNYAHTAAAIPLIAVPADRTGLWPTPMPYSIPSSQSDPGCLARKNPIIRPSLWTTQDMGAGVMQVGFYYPPLPGDTQGSTYYTSVVWAEGDWYLTDQSVDDVALIGGHEPSRPQYAPTPVGWSAW